MVIWPLTHRQSKQPTLDSTYVISVTTPNNASKWWERAIIEIDKLTTCKTIFFRTCKATQCRDCIRNRERHSRAKARATGCRFNVITKKWESREANKHGNQLRADATAFCGIPLLKFIRTVLTAPYWPYQRLINREKHHSARETRATGMTVKKYSAIEIKLSCHKTDDCKLNVATHATQNNAWHYERPISSVGHLSILEVILISLRGGATENTLRLWANISKTAIRMGQKNWISHRGPWVTCVVAA